MSESVIDFASLDSAVATSDAPVVDAPAVDAPVVDADASVVDTDATKDGNTDGLKKDAKPQFNSDGTPKEEAVEKKDDLPGTEKTPQEIRSLLKSMRDADPKNVAAVKQLHGAFERWEAAKTLYPGGIKEMTAAKEFMGLVGGHEGLEKLQNTSAAAEASDNQLYEGSPELIKNIVDDLKAHNKLDALGKLAPA